MVARSEFMKRVFDEIAEQGERQKIVRASILEKITVKKVPPTMLHPNPDDEFSQIKIGPNESIMENYCREARRCMQYNLPIFEEPVIVQKLSDKRGYLILNGHHRWGGAIKAGAPSIRITIVNPRK